MTTSGTIDERPKAGRITAIRILALGGLGAALAAFIPASANAQIYGAWGYRTWREPVEIAPDLPRGFERRQNFRSDDPDTLTRTEIRDILAYRGFRVSGPMERQGDVFVATVLDRNNRSGRVVVDALDGVILEHIVTGAGVRPPRDIPRRGDDFRDTEDFPQSVGEPRVVTGVGPALRGEPQTKQKVAVAREPKSATAPKPVERKALPSQSMKSPKPPSARPEARVPERQSAAAPQASKPELPAAPVETAPFVIEAPPEVPRIPEIARNPGGVANGVPVNPLE